MYTMDCISVALAIYVQLSVTFLLNRSPTAFPSLRNRYPAAVMKPSRGARLIKYSSLVSVNPNIRLSAFRIRTGNSFKDAEIRSHSL